MLHSHKECDDDTIMKFSMGRKKADGLYVYDGNERWGYIYVCEVEEDNTHAWVEALNTSNNVNIMMTAPTVNGRLKQYSWTNNHDERGEIEEWNKGWTLQLNRGNNGRRSMICAPHEWIGNDHKDRRMQNGGMGRLEHKKMNEIRNKKCYLLDKYENDN